MLFNVILFASSQYDIYGLPKMEKECLILLELTSQKMPRINLMNSTINIKKIMK